MIMLYSARPPKPTMLLVSRKPDIFFRNQAMYVTQQQLLEKMSPQLQAHLRFSTSELREGGFLKVFPEGWVRFDMRVGVQLQRIFERLTISGLHSLRNTCDDMRWACQCLCLRGGAREIPTRHKPKTYPAQAEVCTALTMPWLEKVGPE